MAYRQHAGLPENATGLTGHKSYCGNIKQQDASKTTMHYLFVIPSERIYMFRPKPTALGWATPTGPGPISRPGAGPGLPTLPLNASGRRGPYVVRKPKSVGRPKHVVWCGGRPALARHVVRSVASSTDCLLPGGT